MVKLIGVTLAATKRVGDKPTEVREHKDGIKVFENGRWSEKTFINVTSGERSGEQRPFVVVHLEERNSESIGGGNRAADPYYGTFRPDGSISWNNKIHPMEFIAALQAANNDPKGMDFIVTILDEFVGARREKYLAMDEWDFADMAKQHDLKLKSAGRFMTLPNEDEPLFKGLSIDKYEVNGRLAERYTTFIYTPTIKAGLLPVLRAFVDANPALIITSKDEKGNVAEIMSLEKRTQEQDDRKIDPVILEKRRIIATLTLPNADEKNLQATYDAEYGKIQDMDSELNLLDPKDVTAEMQKAREELGKTVTGIKAKLTAATKVRLDELAKAKAAL